MAWWHRLSSLCRRRLNLHDPIWVTPGDENLLVGAYPCVRPIHGRTRMCAPTVDFHGKACGYTFQCRLMAFAEKKNPRRVMRLGKKVLYYINKP